MKMPASANGMDEAAVIPQSSFLDIERDGDRLRLSLERCLNEHFGLRVRQDEVSRWVRLSLRPLGETNALDDEMHFTVITSPESPAAIIAALRQIDQHLWAIAERPLTSGLVQTLLGITSRERRRWTRDGRLISSPAPIRSAGNK
jgi:hypothetical protein